MVLILLSWLYTFFTSITLGIGFARLFQVKSLNVVITCILGLFGVTLLAGSWAIFGPISIEFHVFLLGTSIGLGYYYKTNLKAIVVNTFIQLSSFSLVTKVLLAFSSLLILGQSATLPFIIDNETYYIQTIQWLNEYGFVPGLANLHLFLGQTSGWHITQSVYSFSFLYDGFNDLNGYLLLMANFWAFQKLHSYFTNGNRLDLTFGLLPLTYVFLFQFVSAPSPDLPVYLIAMLVFSMYLKPTQDEALEKFNLTTILVLFAIYIKITAVVLLVLPFLLLTKHFIHFKNQLVPIRLLGGLVLFLFAIKNIMLTGYPLYPLPFFPYSSADYVVPMDIMSYFFGQEMMHSFYMGFGTFERASFFDLIKQYFLHSGIDSIMGLATLFLLIISPFIISKYYPKQKLHNIYYVFITLLILLIFSSPQYRFYIYFTIFFGLVFLSVLFTQKKLILGILSLSFIVVGIFVFVPISFRALTHNKLLENNSTLHFENIIYPQPNTKEKHDYTKIIKGNLEYQSPSKAKLFWITGNGNLPCVNEEQLDYFETHFHVVPQVRGKTLGEGFYAQKTKNHD